MHYITLPENSKNKEILGGLDETAPPTIPPTPVICLNNISACTGLLQYCSNKYIILDVYPIIFIGTINMTLTRLIAWRFIIQELVLL